MLPTHNGSIRLFQVFGITVFLHWSWFLIAALQFHWAQQNDLFSTSLWHLVVYCSLFGIVMLHEFGHALACRSVGGQANQIVLWPLGGVAYVRPPQRPGPVLWSIAAGPLVNLALVPITLAVLGLAISGAAGQWPQDVVTFVKVITAINLALLVFNILPIYPLDGGQIVQAVLWFFIGRSRSLAISAGIGIGAGGLIVVLALLAGRLWWVVLGVFILMQAFRGFAAARMLGQQEQVDRDSRAAEDDRIRQQYGRWD